MWRTENDQFTPGINPRLSGFRRNKNNSYEVFNGEPPPPPPPLPSGRQRNDTRVCPVFTGAATVALFAPAATLALARPETTATPVEALPMVIIVAGMTGEIKVFQNSGSPVKL